MAFELDNVIMKRKVKANFQEAEARIVAIEDSVGQPEGIASLDNDGLVPLNQLPANAKSSKVVADITARNAIASGDRFEGLRVHVIDATGDNTVTTGAAGYVLKSGLSNNDWSKAYESESLDLDFSDFYKMSENTSDDVTEGEDNLFFTNQRAKDAVVLDNMDGSETDQSGSVQAVKNYVTSQISSTARKYVKKVATGSIATSEDKVYAAITTAGITLTLPSVGASENGQSHTIFNAESSTQNITLVPSDSDTIEGASSLILEPAEEIELVYDHASTNWIENKA